MIDLPNLRLLCFGGVPEGRGRRALSWKLLLNYLPNEKSLWKENLERQRQLYYQLTGLNDFFFVFFFFFTFNFANIPFG